MPELIANESDRKSFKEYMAKALPRMLSYGLILWFMLDLGEVLFTYFSSFSRNEATLIAQIIDRIAVPLLGYTLMFTYPPTDPGTMERMFRKLISYFALLMTFGSIACVVVIPLANLKAYRATFWRSQETYRSRVQTYTGIQQGLNKLNDGQVATVHAELVRTLGLNPKVPPGEQRAAVKTGLQQAIEREGITTTTADKQLRGAIIVSTIKYVGEGFIAGVLFFVVWQASITARKSTVFRRYSSSYAPTRESKRITFLTLWGYALADFFAPPKMEDFRWYRRLKRFFNR